MPKSLVLGLGNLLSGADAFGPAVIELLRRRTDLPRDVDLVDAHTDLLAHIVRFEACDLVVLVDAVLGADGEGVAVIGEDIFAQWEDRSIGAHQLSAIGAVKLFRTLHPETRRHFPVIKLVACFVREDRFGQGAGAADVTAGAEAVRRVLQDRA